MSDHADSAEARALEPWLRNTHTELPGVLRGVVHALELAQEDAVRWCCKLSDEEGNARPARLPSVGFQLRHIAGSLDRLATYAEGRDLDAAQLAALREEPRMNSSMDVLLRGFTEALSVAGDRVRAFAGADLEQVRWVGRGRLPTTLGGLLVHIADHTQRHCGQMVTTAKVVLAMRDSTTSPDSL